MVAYDSSTWVHLFYHRRGEGPDRPALQHLFVLRSMNYRVENILGNIFAFICPNGCTRTQGEECHYHGYLSFLSGRVVVHTEWFVFANRGMCSAIGAARGIGFAFTEAVIEAGGNVAVLDILDQPWDECAALIKREPQRCHYFRCVYRGILSWKLGEFC
jgi:hypothetical protein